jgi:hypothetical protein
MPALCQADVILPFFFSPEVKITDDTPLLVSYAENE